MKETLNIGIVLNTAWNIYNFRLGLVQAFINAGHNVIAFAPSDDFVKEIEATGCVFVPLQKLSRKGVNPLEDLQLVNELRKHYRTHKLDVVLHYTIKPNIYGSIASRLAGVKSIATVTGLGYSFLSTGIVNKVVKKLYAFAFKKVNVVAFQNRDDKALFEKLKLCSSNQTALINGSGIKTAFFKPVPKSKNYDNFIFLFVGRLLYDKGVKELFEAAKRLKASDKKVELWVVGGIDEGNPSAIQKEEVSVLVDSGVINYIGHSNDVRSIMQEADAVVLPSYREGLPRVMLESLSMAKPVITTDAPGCKETVVHGENGYLVPTKDSNALFLAMLKMLEKTPEERQEMGAKGRQMALERFDEQAIIKTYFQHLEAMDFE